MYHQFNIQQFYVLPTHSVFMCFVWISEQTAIISLYNINSLVSITDKQCVYCAVRTGHLYKRLVNICLIICKLHLISTSHLAILQLDLTAHKSLIPFFNSVHKPLLLLIQMYWTNANNKLPFDITQFGEE